jgi:uncharacterized protein YjbI with pentapeptide repeats
MDANQTLTHYPNGKRGFRLRDLKDIFLIHAGLKKTDFTGSDWKKTDLSNTSLGKVNFNWAYLEEVSLKGAKMLDSKMHSGYLVHTKYLDFCQI